MTAHERVAEALDTQRRRLGINWREFARRAGMSEQHVLRIRKGGIALTRDAAAGLDRAAQWVEGTAMALYSDPNAKAPAGPALTEERIGMGDLSAAEAHDLLGRVLPLGDSLYWEALVRLAQKRQTLQGDARTA